MLPPSPTNTCWIHRGAEPQWFPSTASKCCDELIKNCGFTMKNRWFNHQNPWFTLVYPFKNAIWPWKRGKAGRHYYQEWGSCHLWSDLISDHNVLFCFDLFWLIGYDEIQTRDDYPQPLAILMCNWWFPGGSSRVIWTLDVYSCWCRCFKKSGCIHDNATPATLTIVSPTALGPVVSHFISISSPSSMYIHVIMECPIHFLQEQTEKANKILLFCWRNADQMSWDLAVWEMALGLVSSLHV